VQGTFSQVTSGTTFSCGLKTNGFVVCWGGNENKVISTIPEGPFSQIDAGWYHVCALRADNSVTCWGTDVDVKVRY
jgi:alpha-tubulin suppressor-like RCC1 family protein